MASFKGVWIESHQSLERHPKTLKLSAAMGWNLYETVGRLHAFWWWCIDYAPDGDLRKHSNTVLAVAVGIDPTAGNQFIDAMVNCGGKDGPGFVDREPYFRIHDWFQYAGEYLRSRYRRKTVEYSRIKELYSNQQLSSGTVLARARHGAGTVHLPPSFPLPPPLASPSFSPSLPLSESPPTPLTGGEGVDNFTKNGNSKNGTHNKHLDFENVRSHIQTTFLKMRNQRLFWAPTFDNKLSRLIEFYTPWDVMALFDSYLGLDDAYLKNAGYSFNLFLAKVPALVDIPGVKLIAKRYETQLNGPMPLDLSPILAKIGN